MSFVSRLHYYRRIYSAYLGRGQSQLNFWHDVPRLNQNASAGHLGDYYMDFSAKADYAGPYDGSGIPMLDYRGRIGLQYNPIAVAQWGLGNYNLFCRTKDPERKNKFLYASDWLSAHLEQNSSGIAVWNHDFDWEYRTSLRAPWYSALAQGQGISLLVRAHLSSGRESYLVAARKAFPSFLTSVDQGGVLFTDDASNPWFEEYIVSPPTHILNGFIWAVWGVYDYFLATRDKAARTLFDHAVQTLAKNLERYDLGFWSLYEQSGTRLPMVASSFYHGLHVVQLRVMHRLTGERIFARVADRWEGYARNRTNRVRALCYKCVFKVCHY